VAAFAFALVAPVAGCGSDKEERGLTDFPEEATPESAEAMAETEKDRDEEMAHDLSGE
jgi:hypothetical protein